MSVVEYIIDEVNEENQGIVDGFKSQLMQCIELPDKIPISVLLFSHNGGFLATGASNGGVAIWRVLQHDKEDFEKIKTSSCEFLKTVGVGGRILSDREEQKFEDAHTQEVTGLSWSESQFLLSSSMDYTVKLWHVQRQFCLYVFKHDGPVTGVSFAPDRDFLFATACSDNVARMWSVEEGRVLCSTVRTENDLTALFFYKNALLTGHGDGEVRLYRVIEDRHGKTKNVSHKLEYFTSIDCRNRHGRNRKGCRVTGMQCVTNGNRNPETQSKEFLLVTTNDSRIRLCTLDTFMCIYKFKGAVNCTYPITADSADFAQYIICASEDNTVCVWPYEAIDDKASAGNKALFRLVGGVRKSSVCHRFPVHGSRVTCAIFLPSCSYNMTIDASEIRKRSDVASQLVGSIFITAGMDGHMHIFQVLRR